MTIIRQFRDDKKGATAIEYGLIAALIAIAAITAMTNLGQTVNRTLQNASDGMNRAGPAAAPAT